MSKSGIKVPHIPSGIEDFAEMMQCKTALSDCPITIADKTRFLPDILSPERKVTVFTRPIRFMKSSTLSMLARFLSVKDAESNRLLFNGLDINDEKYATFRSRHQGQFPVIHLTFKNVEQNTWADCKQYLAAIMSDLYGANSEVLASLDEYQKEQYLRIRSKQGSYVELECSLANLATYLSKHYQKKVIILIDEYDTPLHNAHKRTKKAERNQPDSYFYSMTKFMGAFLREALKGHAGVEKGFMTGVSYIAFSGMHSSLNNTRTYSVFDPKFVELFGFTEPEVDHLINQVESIGAEQRNKLRTAIQQWYNGYYIGDNPMRIYNPWSVAQFFNSLPTNANMSGKAYWLQVGDSFALSEHLEPRFGRLQSKLTDLMLSKKIQVEADERMKLLDLDDIHNDNAFWSLLLHAGYLSASNIEYGSETTTCEVSIPNYEVQNAYAYLIKRQQRKYDPNLEYGNAMMAALIAGDIPEFAKNLQIFMEQAVSFYDMPKTSMPNHKLQEQLHHSFILGLLAGMLNKYHLSSNRESGHGRYDIMLTPRQEGGHGLIFEFKSTNNQDKLPKLAKEALSQIAEKRYAAALESTGVSAGIHIGMSFCGKHFHIEHKKVRYESHSATVVSV